MTVNKAKKDAEGNLVVVDVFSGRQLPLGSTEEQIHLAVQAARAERESRDKKDEEF